MKPMLCKMQTIVEAKDALNDDWLLEQKYDGVRAYIEGGKLYDRRGVEITARFPEFESLENIKQTVDGEIIIENAEFGDVAGRMHLKDKFTIKLLSKKKPCVLMLFDMLSEKPLHSRRASLENSGLREQYSWIRYAKQHSFSSLSLLWSDVLATNKEGLVAKHKNGRYEQGKRSNEWLKIKAFIETSAIFTKYEVHPKGVTIETDDGRRVVVNGSQAQNVIKQFGLHGQITAEIQYLPQIESDAWRFPSFRKLLVGGSENK